MFQTKFLQDDQSYIVADYDSISLTVWILQFHQRVPRLEKCVRSFFPSKNHDFQSNVFAKHFEQCCDHLRKCGYQIPKEVCVFIDQSESLVISSGYTFSRKEPRDAIDLEELNGYASQLVKQADAQSKRIWSEEYGYSESDRTLISIFLSQLSLDKKIHSFPIWKEAHQVSMRCLFFFWSHSLLEGLSRSIQLCGCKLISCIPISCVFLNNICNCHTLLWNHLHIHYGYDSIDVILHLGKHVQEIQSLPIWWRYISDQLSQYLSPLEREALLMWFESSQLEKYAEWWNYRDFLTISIRAIFERFDLQWSFSEISLSSQWPLQLIQSIISDGDLTPWIQKNATIRRYSDHNNDHWLQYCNTLDPLFSIHPHPLLALMRTVFFTDHDII